MKVHSFDVGFGSGLFVGMWVLGGVPFVRAFGIAFGLFLVVNGVKGLLP